MKQVAEREGLSLKYLEQILPVLTKHKMIEGVHGKGGGYRLTRAPQEYTIDEILRLTEGSLAPRIVHLSRRALSARRPMQNSSHVASAGQAYKRFFVRHYACGPHDGRQVERQSIVCRQSCA